MRSSSSSSSDDEDSSDSDDSDSESEESDSTGFFLFLVSDCGTRRLPPLLPVLLFLFLAGVDGALLVDAALSFSPSEVSCRGFGGPRGRGAGVAALLSSDTIDVVPFGFLLITY
jgi:hypothetical protein